MTVATAEDQGHAARAGRSSDLVMTFRQNSPLFAAIALFLVLWVFYNAFHPRGFSPQVMVQNANEAFSLALVAMAQTVPVLAGGLDLSVGAVMTLVGCVASHLLSGSPGEIAFGILVCLLSGALAGLVNGLVVVYGRIQPIIATLATGAVYIGLALMLRPEPGGEVDEDLNWAVTNALPDLVETFALGEGGFWSYFNWLPVPVILLVLIVVLVWVPFRRSVTGRAVYAIGSAEGAAYMSGLNLDRAKIAAFTLAGFLAGIAGTFLAIQTASGNADIPQAGAYTLNSIAAVVIGGTSLLGGAGSAIGSIFGAFVLRVISFNFRIFDVDPLLQPLFEGIILLAAVSLGAIGILRIKNTLELFR
jgi:ribose transport system permease protein